MDSSPGPIRFRPSDADAAPLSSRARLERISEPWSLNRSIAVIGTLILAVILGSWAANGEIENIILLLFGFIAVMIIVFVHDYWWSPPLIITALDFGANIAGFPFGGMQIGVAILALTFPVKIAMKTLRKAEPRMALGLIYWILLTFVTVHCVVAVSYNKIEGTLVLKNIFKSYFTVITPLIFYGLLMRYCNVRTIRPTVIALFFTVLFTIAMSTVVLLKDVSVNALTDLRISIGWLDSAGAMALLRQYGPYLFIGSLAAGPVVRSPLGKFIVRLSLVVAAFGVLVSSGRLPTATCVAAGVFFAVVRGRLWLAFPVIIITLLTSAVLTLAPDLVFSLPFTIQRSLSPFNFSNEGVEMQQDLSSSDDWHRTLRNRSLEYWTQDTNSFWLGHGYKSWDYSMSQTENTGDADYERLTQLAVEMGATENMFSSITNIFGFTGLLLYGCFLGHIGWLLVKGCRLAPVGTMARALCEFSLINLIASVVFCFVMGTVPNFDLIFMQLGILAARPYLAPQVAATAPVVPAFARPALATLAESRRFRHGRA